ncbi:homoserine kinase [Elstera cyanobacteriorum]|uniref:Homoserine kinase n=1 Tax=Elstera cyanobacteriorum TaxID=2022747 RepID=A0A255XUB9_9PROT|nr:homoserine kinase [Elstera cyanobacteriorum]OYQ20599.1 homoserine kinase [Elstera cyanobacteriorum]GFZ99621.1 homoserine kinase [Elstera cyanobacteriorum]
MAVYTDIPDEELRAFVAEYGIGEVTSYMGIAEGVENSNFLIYTTEGRYILTLYEKRVNPDDLPFFIGLMDHLAAQGLSCPIPLTTQDGQRLRTLRDRPAAMVSFLPGVWPRRIAPVHTAELGEALAKLHLAGADFPMQRVNALSVDGWEKLVAATAARADSVRPGLSAALAEEFAFLKAHWPQDLPRGVIHADLFPDNVFFIGDKVSGLIDFYFACTDALVYDVSICLNAWCFEADGSFNMTKAMGFLRRYQAVRPLSAAEIAALPIFCRGSALRFLLTRLYDWLNVPPGALVKPKDPMEYWTKLRFHRLVTDAAAYGLEGAV